LLIARKSEGSMRDAESILDQMVSFTNGKITVEAVQNSLGLINEEMFFEFTALMLEKDDAKIIEFAQKVFKSGHDLLDFVYGLQEHFRNLLVVKSTGNAKLIETSDYFKNLYRERAGNFAENDLLQYFEILLQSENLIKFSPNPQLILELLLLKLAHKPLSLNLEELLAFIKKSPGMAATSKPATQTSLLNTGPGSTAGSAPTHKKKVEPVAKKPKPVVKEQSRSPFEGLKHDPFPQEDKPVKKTTAEMGSGRQKVTLETIQNNWQQVVNAVKGKKIAVGSFLVDGVAHKLEENYLEIAFDIKTQFHVDHIEKNSPIIEKVLAEQFQTPLRIKCVAIDFEKAGIEKQSRSPAEIIEDMKNKQEVFKQIIDIFDCHEVDDV
ncbi:MAG: hypothetical protein ACE5GL_09035, partial [Calditrichia bacterium]